MIAGEDAAGENGGLVSGKNAEADRKKTPKARVRSAPKAVSDDMPISVNCFDALAL
jgi:hypothetical protein